jgi:hypothetical protein
LENRESVSVDDKTAALLCNEGCGRRLSVILVWFIVKIVQTVFVIRFLFRNGNLVLFIDGLPADIVARLS